MTIQEKRYKDMMYSEFVKGTGCKENNHNYNIFIKLEDLYMNSDITKEEKNKIKILKWVLE